jgi:hypothetical protein
MRHSIFRDGLVAGALGATSVAIVFFAIDCIARQPLQTPFVLANGLLGLIHLAMANKVAVVIVYTVFHYAAFIAVGCLAAGIIHWAERVPSVLAGAFLLFVVIELGFYLMTFLLGQSPTYGGLSALQVSVGNLIAAAVMGTYLWRTHPALKTNLDYALSGRP